MSNLPEWPGASVVYARCMAINERLSRLAFEAWRAKHKAPTKRMQFRVPECVRDCIDALNRGDEEYLKAYAYEHRSHWQA